MVKLYYSLAYTHLACALLSWGRSGRTNAAKIECAHRRGRQLLTEYNHRILTFHSAYPCAHGLSVCTRHTTACPCAKGWHWFLHLAQPAATDARSKFRQDCQHIKIMLRVTTAHQMLYQMLPAH